jgi:hypothetical protein
MVSKLKHLKILKTSNLDELMSFAAHRICLVKCDVCKGKLPEIWDADLNEHTSWHRHGTGWRMKSLKNI